MYNNRRQKDKRTRKTMETIGLFSGVLFFSVLCLLPEVRALGGELRRRESKGTYECSAT